MTPDGAEVRLPNAALFEHTLINYSQHRERRLRFVVPLAQRADLHVAQEVGRQALLQLRGIKPEPPPFMRVRTLGRDFVEVEFFAWVDQDMVNFYTVESRARRAVLESLAKSGVQFPEDTQIVQLQRAPEMSAAIDDDNREAEDLDEAFVQQQLDRARTRMTDKERDLLVDR
jgi:small conductance mechanosensitive channel